MDNEAEVVIPDVRRRSNEGLTNGDSAYIRVCEQSSLPVCQSQLKQDDSKSENAVGIDFQVLSIEFSSTLQRYIVHDVGLQKYGVCAYTYVTADINVACACTSHAARISYHGGQT
jgi:hypothetical protein